MLWSVSGVSLLAAVSTAAAAAVQRRDADTGFDPYQYHLTQTSCAAVNRETFKNVPLSLEYLDLNPSGSDRTLLLVHGWPSIWTEWGPQILEFSKDYRLIVPNLRGFGNSSFPADAFKSSGTFYDIAGDLKCILDAAGVEKAVCVGVDWGSQWCLEAARIYTDTILAASSTIPYQPHYVPAAITSIALPSLSYQVYFNSHVDNAIAELEKDIRRTLRGTYRSYANPGPADQLHSKTDFLGVYGDDEIDPIAFLSSKEEDYLVEQFSIQGFAQNLYVYQGENRVIQEVYTLATGGPTIHQPVLFLPPDQDPAIPDFDKVMKVQLAYLHVPNNQVKNIGPSSHFVTLDAPGPYNAALREWLETVVYV